jgi:hypothetical protein
MSDCCKSRLTWKAFSKSWCVKMVKIKLSLLLVFCTAIFQIGDVNCNRCSNLNDIMCWKDNMGCLGGRQILSKHRRNTNFLKMQTNSYLVAVSKRFSTGDNAIVLFLHFINKVRQLVSEGGFPRHPKGYNLPQVVSCAKNKLNIASH